jgi:PAS domain S-box-containing protein
LEAIDTFSDSPELDGRVAKRAHSESPVDEEVPFSCDDIFFSRTNEKGHILYVNSTFQRISLYTRDELNGQPHNIIRHPDMPRGVFWIVWSAIKKQEPVGAYIKNKAKDGRYYWVFAIITPIIGGYLSVRLKPCSPIFPMIEEEYSALAKAENDQNLKPSESAQVLISRLGELGFPDYAAFMATAFGREIVARDAQLERSSLARHFHFEELANAADALFTTTNAIFENYKIHKDIPSQLRKQAEQLGDIGAAIGLVSENYKSLSPSMNANMPSFMAASQRLLSTLNKGIFLLCTAAIQKEAKELFEAERLANQLEPTGDLVVLHQQCISYQAEASKILFAAAREASLLEHICADLLKAALSLKTSLVIGRAGNVEKACAEAGFTHLLHEFDRRHVALVDGLKVALDIYRTIQRSAIELRPWIAYGAASRT